MRVRLICLLAALAVTAASEGTGSPAQPADRLSQVRRIYVESFGEGLEIKLLREKVVTELATDKTGYKLTEWHGLPALSQTQRRHEVRFIVVDGKEEADAILVGTAQVEGSGKECAGTLVVRLVGKSGEVLWRLSADESGKKGGCPAVGSWLSARVAYGLLDAAEEDSKR